MTETYAGPPASDDIEVGADTTTARLDREADSILREAEAGTSGAPPLRRAVREDATAARDWGRDRAEHLRDAVQAEPVKASLYALALGVVIGLLIAR